METPGLGLLRGFVKNKCSYLERTIEKVATSNYSIGVRYGLAVLITAVGALSAYALQSAVGIFGFPIFFLSTVLAAICGGFGPGILAAALSSVCVDQHLFGLFPQKIFPGYYGMFRMSAFSLVVLCVSVLTSALRNSFGRAEAARKEAELSGREKDAVMAFLSHDLRGPLSSASLSFQLLRKHAEAGGHEQEILRLADNGLFFCQRMTQLVQSLLDASKIRASGIALDPTLQDVKEIVAQAYVEHRLLAEQKCIDFSWECVSSGSFGVSCDKVLLTQALANLILNAFKFTPAGGSVSISLGEKAGTVEIRVKDSGQGIPSVQLPRVFEKFWQAKGSSAEGVGLGLFITRAIVEAHKGSVAAESRWGHGATFVIRLPLHGRGQNNDCVSLGQKSA